MPEAAAQELRVGPRPRVLVSAPAANPAAEKSLFSHIWRACVTGSRVAPERRVEHCRRRAPASGHGFTLIEVLIALAVLVAVTLGVVQLFAAAVTGTRSARDRTIAVTLAAAKLEQLRSLAWRLEVDDAGVAVARTDVSSNLSVDPISGGGPGLAESPPGTLDRDTPPYVDYLDRLGRWSGTGAEPPGGAVYIRRWAVRRHPSHPQRLIALQVLVTTVSRERSRTSGAAHAWNGIDVVLTTMMARKVR
jgi:prepilin-type N-terminal cleavage/methylation domain-containing protein